MSIEDYEGLKNGLKPDMLKKFQIADLFLPGMDNVLRNGIGHNSAHYDAVRDEVVYTVEGKGELRMPYTQFVARVMDTYSSFELASKYFHVLHGEVEGKLQP